MSERRDLELIARLVPRGARVLDLGCGSGEMLAYLRDTRGCSGYGVEIDDANVHACVQRGVHLGVVELDAVAAAAALAHQVRQHLTAAAIQAELLARDLEAAGATTAQRSAEHVEAMVSDAVAQTRLLARGLFPVEIGEDGLMAALQQLADTTRRQLRRPCTLVCPEPVDLEDHDTAIHLYRMAQEGVNNAVKHAPGAPITVALHRAPDGLRLSVRNPLLATDAAAAREGDAGIGLRIMQHRAQLIQARLQAGPQGPDWLLTVTWNGGMAKAPGRPA